MAKLLAKYALLVVGIVIGLFTREIVEAVSEEEPVEASF